MTPDASLPMAVARQKTRASKFEIGKLQKFSARKRGVDASLFCYAHFAFKNRRGYIPKM
jgi:hypothetical protein